MNEKRLREGLLAIPVPDEDGARERALRVVGAARPGEVASPGRQRRRRRAAELAVALALLAAVAISPAGAAVSDWVADAVDGGREPALPALTSLPAPGPVLVDSSTGAWVVQEDGSKRLLGDYRESTWSPHGLFVAAVGGGEIVALDPRGDVRWALARAGGLSDPAWSRDGYRIAYRDGRSVRVLAGDGTGDHAAWPRSAPVAPAWRPGPGHELTLVEPGGAVRTIDADSGTSLAVVDTGLRPTGLEWSRDGSRLLVLGHSGVELRDRGGEELWSRRAPPGTELVSATLAADGAQVAAIVSSRRPPRRSELLLFGPGRRSLPVFSGPGRFSGITASSDGRWLLLEWETADQWLFLDPDHPQGVIAVSDIAAQFAPGVTSPAAFPSVAGWCCQGPPAGAGP